MDIKSFLQPYADQVIQIRRDLHRIPELAYEEKKTSAYVADFLKKERLAVSTGIARTGVVGLLDTGRPGPCLLIRADMDALPITEENDLPFASEHPGTMHACGHDAHTAMVLAAAKAIKAMAKQIKGSVKFVFQPAEEGTGGAKPMIEEGVLENPKVDYALGCHVWPNIPEGTVGIRTGALLAAMFKFDITIKGKGGHAAMPHLCVDALDVGCQVVDALQRIVSRKLNPLHPSVLSVGQFQSGTTFNVIPESAFISGTARTFDKTTWKGWSKSIETVVKGVCQAMGATYETDFEQGFPPTVNDAKIADRLRGIAADVVGAKQVVIPDPSLGGEDMAYFLEKVPGCFFCLGVGNDAFPGIHNPRFWFKEDLLINGVEMYCRAALDLLG
ncbi:MAG: peptidase M20 [Proteobacteria bacterium]|nr:MAG: peptidase M20 [Pseudomonadota bacterium]